MKKTVAFAIGAVLMLAGSSWLPGSILPPKLHIQAVGITHTKCNQPLNFAIYIKNIGPSTFHGSFRVLISVPDNHISTNYDVTIRPGVIFASIQASPNISFRADCSKVVYFTITLVANAAGDELSVWDQVPFVIYTQPDSAHGEVKPYVQRSMPRVTAKKEISGAISGL